MRIRLLCAGAVVVLLGLFSGMGVAHAQSEEELRTECIETLEAGGVPADCQEAPSPIKPATNELIWGAISFTILFVVLYKFGYPAIQKGMHDRTERIRSDLDSADTAKTEAEAELTKYQAQLKGAREESTRMRDDARSEMEEYKAQRKTEIDAELAEYRDRSKAEADAAKSQAMSDVKSDVAALAIGAAEHVVQKSLDRETNIALVESYIDSVDARG